MSGEAIATALDMCHAARRAWERSQPQMFLELSEGGTTAAAENIPLGSAGTPPTVTNDTAPVASPERASATGATGGNDA